VGIELVAHDRLVERQVRRSATASLCGRVALVIESVAIETGPQERAKAGATGLVRTQRFLFPQANQERLCDVLGVRGLHAPAAPQVRHHDRAIRCSQLVERHPALLGAAVGESLDE
jgi:hypothetical protein